ncbi:MAG TPA: GMC family oxidoreductase N-terminal domain-containing protein [Gaiellaceae bacterium]|nr:GMC family oxidoreductase N-terminal domain-containing protein [Gaiellaceae bacterium]
MRDVIVVGAGAGGPVVAKELAARGLDVLLLEAGPAFEDADHQWSHDEGVANNPASGIFRFGPGDRAQAPWPRDLPQNSFVWQTAGVGGSTLHYFANSPRAMPDALASYRELIPYYEWVEHTLPVQTAAMGTKEELFLRGATKAGLPTQTSKDITRDACRPQENAILQPRGTAGKSNKASQLVYPRAQGCTFCGHCPQGCYLPLKAPRNLKAKRSTHTSYGPMALTADRWTRGRAATLVPDAFAVKVAADGSARSVTWRNTRTGALTKDEARVVVLAAGPIETPRLWLNSGLPNPDDQVGRGLTDHFLDFVVGRFPRYTGSTKGATSAARADFPGHGCIEQVGAVPGLQAQGLTVSEDPRRRLVGARLERFVSDFDRLLSLAVITDDDVAPENRVTLSSVMTPDVHGPVARIEIRRRTARTLANRDFLAARAAEILRAAGAREIVRMNWAPVLLHIHSTMRIGTVLTDDAESRRVERLFVADNSMLPNSLGGPNPTLTTQALATRTAERIFVRYFGGDPWVGRESPVSSVDDSVTAAVVSAGL